MAEVIYTIRQILQDLNGLGDDGNPKGAPWSEVPEIHVVAEAIVDSYNSIKPQSRGMAVKIFRNHLTGELRIFLAKVINTPEAPLLP